MKTLNQLLNEGLLEVYEKSVYTDYECNNVSGEYIPEKQDIRCKFTANSGNKYDVDFFVLKEPKTILINNKSIVDISFNISDNKEYAYLISPAFTESGRDEINYDKSTYKNEQYEVIGKVSYIFEQFLKDHLEYNIFVIFTEIDRRKLEIYKFIFNKRFKNKFYFIKGQSRYSKDKSGYGYYFIKK